MVWHPEQTLLVELVPSRSAELEKGDNIPSSSTSSLETGQDSGGTPSGGLTGFTGAVEGLM
jgi:hypothetical protein